LLLSKTFVSSLTTILHGPSATVKGTETITQQEPQAQSQP